MTTLQQMRARALMAAPFEYPPEQRFVLQLADWAARQPAIALKPRQSAWLVKLSWDYRTYIPRELWPAQDPYPNAASWTHSTGGSDS